MAANSKQTQTANQAAETVEQVQQAQQQQQTPNANQGNGGGQHVPPHQENPNGAPKMTARFFDANSAPEVSVLSLFGDAGPLIGDNSSSLSVTKLAEALKQVLVVNSATKAELKSFTVSTVSQEQTGNFGAVVVSGHVIHHNKNLVAAYVIMVEDGSQVEQQVTKTDATGKSLSLTLTAPDRFNKNYFDNITAMLRNLYNDKNILVLQSGMMVHYQENQIVDKDEKPLPNVSKMLNQACLAVRTRLTREINGGLTGKFTWAGIQKNKQSQIINHLVYTKPTTMQSNGLPTRTDLGMEVTLIQNIPQAQGQPERRPFKLSSIYGYTQLLWRGSQQAQSFGNFGGKNFDPQQFVARMVATDLSSNTSTSIMETLLLAIANMSAFTDNRNFRHQFRDTYLKPKESLCNIGAIGYLLPELNRVRDNDYNKPTGDDVSDFITNDEMLDKFIGTIVQPSYIYSVEVPRGGDNSWLLQTISDSARGVPQASRQVIDAINGFSNGVFIPLFARALGLGPDQMDQVYNARLFINQDDVNLVGHFQQSGELVDARNVDIVALANVAKHNARGVVQTWLNTFDPRVDSATRLAKRAAILTELIPGLSVKDYSHTYDISSKFYKAVVDTLNHIGYTVTESGTGQNHQDVQFSYSNDLSDAMIQDVNIRRSSGFGNSNGSFSGFNVGGNFRSNFY